MDPKTKKSSIGEAQVIVCLLKNNYDVFQQTNGKAPFDLVAYKEGKLIKIEVKSTSSRTRANTGWEVHLKKVRSNKTVNRIYPFDNELCDILAVYIEPLDRILFFESLSIKTKAAMVILDKDLEAQPDWRRDPV